MAENWCKTISEATKWAMTLIVMSIKYWKLAMLHIEYIYDDSIVEDDGRMEKIRDERKTFYRKRKKKEKKILCNS